MGSAVADEYDAAQDRGEVAKHGTNRFDKVEIPDENLYTVSDIGITSKEVYEARQVRDAEEAEPGIVRRTLDGIPISIPIPLWHEGNACASLPESVDS